MIEATLPQGFELRPASTEDAEALAGIVNTCMIAETGEPFTTVEQIRGDLTAPGRDTSHDDVIVESADGTPVGYLQLWADIAPFDKILMLVFVIPACWERGISTALLRIGTERARDKLPLSPPEHRVVVQVARFTGNEAAGKLFEREGFAPVRVFLEMRIRFEPAPRAASVPRGIDIRTFDRARDEVALHSALFEAFEDHWGHMFPSLEQFVHHQIDGEGSGFDPSLWLLAVEGEEVVGAALCRPSTQDPALGSVDDLGVRRAWRGRGIGLALLLSAFDAMQRAGFSGATLGVDAENPTGATRLYERAGMAVEQEWEFWEKELRPATPSVA